MYKDRYNQKDDNIWARKYTHRKSIKSELSKNTSK